MSSSTAKRIVVYQWERQPAEGFVNPALYLQEDRLEWMTLDGKVRYSPFEEFKALCFSSENGKADLFTEDNLFERRPKVPGLWTRFTFKDKDLLDGILSHNLLEWPAAGYLITPPKARASRQRVFIPRAALAATELRGVVGSSVRARERRKRPTPGVAPQISMFDL